MTNSAYPPLVALHGFLGCKGDWDELFQDLGRDRTCIAIDLPGHGDEPVPKPGTALQVVVERLMEVTEGLGVVDYLGYSMGGRILYQLATDPRLLPWRRIVLVGAHPGIEDEGARQTRRAKDEWLAQELDERAFDAFLDDWYAQPLFGRIKEATGYARLLERRLESNPHALAQALLQMGTGVLPPCWDRLPEIDKPVLLVAGEQDRKYRALNERAARRIPHARTGVVPRAAHAPQVEAPDAFVSVVRGFLDA